MCKGLAIIIFIFTINLNGQNPINLTEDALELYKDGKVELSIQKLDEAINLDPSNANARLMLGQIFIEINRPTQAIKIINPILSLLQNNVEIHFILGAAYFKQKKYQNAINELNTILNLNPDNRKAKELLSLCYLNIGVTNYKKNRKKDAIKNFKKSINTNNKNIQAYKNLALAYFNKKKFDETKSILKKGLRIFPNEILLLKLLIQVLSQTNNIKEALEPAKKLYKNYPNDIDGALTLAYLYRYNNEGDRAFDIYKKLIKKFPAEQKIYDEYAELYKLRNKFDDAITVYNKLLLKTNNKSVVFESIAKIYIQAKRYNEAIVSYRKALLFSNDKSSIYQRIADTYLIENKLKSAIKVYLEALNVYPNHWELNLELSKVYEDVYPDSAISLYKKMVEIQHDNPYPNIRLAVILRKKGFNELAFENCLKAIDLGTEIPLPYHIISELYLNKKDTANSLANEKLSVNKALVEISKFKKIYKSKFSQSINKKNLNQIESWKDDAKILELSQKLLRKSLQNLFQVEKPFDFELDLKDWVKEYPEETLLLEFLGNVYERQKEFIKARSIYEQLIKLKPKDKEGHLGFARIMEKLGKYKKAILAYNRALTIDSNDPEIYHKLISLNMYEDSIERLIQEWMLRTKREPENIILLTNLKSILMSTGKDELFAKVEKMLEEVMKNKDSKK